MKKIYLFIAAAMIAVSCSDDDSKSNRDAGIDANLLIGRWELKSSVYNDNETIPLNSCDTGTFKEFKTSGTFHEHYTCGSNNYEDIANYTVNGNVVSCKVKDATNPAESNFSFTIKELTPDILITEYNGFDEDNKPEKITSVFNKL